MTKKQKKVLIRIIISGVLMFGISALPFEGYLKLFLFLIPYLIIGYDILKKAIRGIINLQPFDENFLMAVATVGAILLGEYSEGCTVMLLYQIGELFQSIAVGKSRRSIQSLMDIRPDCANLLADDGTITEVDPSEVSEGSIIVVKPGERIPIDGIVAEGSSAVDTSALTGESMPADIFEGSEVISGCINLTAPLKIRTTKPFSQSTATKILDMVENAGSRKSQSEDFISKFSKYYTPVVCYSAAALCILPPVCRIIMGLPADFSTWIYRALTFLVISCPCALVISIPLSFFAGIGGASREGILIKGSNYIETLSKVQSLVFDKTGTMTMGVFEVRGVHHNKLEEAKILEYAALAESYSLHPIAKSLTVAYGKEPDKSRVKDVKEIGGYGIEATVDDIAVAIGNEKLMKKLNIEFTPCHHVGTVLHVAFNGEYAGHILVADIVKPDAKKAVSALHKMGIRQTVMLTGDNKAVSEALAKELQIDEVYFQLLPSDKVDLVEKMISESNKGEKLAFVGDGINDAPVISRADVGIAMGIMGSDAAIEAADIVLMDDNPLKIVKAIRISKKCLRIVYENIYFSIGVKLIYLALSAFGFTNMWLAVFADVGVMILAVLNAIRALNVKKL